MFLFGFDSRGVPCSPFLALKVPGSRLRDVVLQKSIKVRET